MKRKLDDESYDMENTGCKTVKSMGGARNEQGVMADNNKMVSDAMTGGQQDDLMFVPQGIKLLFENSSAEIKVHRIYYLHVLTI